MITALVTVAGVLVPSALLAFLVHRLLVPVSRTTFFLALGIALVAVSPGLVPDRVPVPLDEVMRGYPFRGVVGEVSPRNALTNDTVKLFLPWYSAARDQMLDGDLPLWNPWSFAGYPLLANGEAAPLSPFFLATLFVPLPEQIVAMAGVKVFVAFLFGALFLMRLGASRWAAWFGSAAFALSTYQFVYLYYSAATVSALLPAVALGLLLILEDPGRRSISFFAVTVAVAMSSGHPESVLHMIIGGLIVIAAVLIRGGLPDVRRSFLLITGGAILGLAFSAIAWVPVAEQVAQSQRLGEIASHREMNQSFSGLAGWALITPDAFGNPARGTWAWKYNYPGVASSYVGSIVLCLVPLAIFIRNAGAVPRTLAIGAVLTWLSAMKWTFVGYLSEIPPLSLVGNDKLRFVSVFLAAAAAALILDRLRALRALPAFALAALVFNAGWLAIALQYFPDRLGPYALIGPAAVIGFGLVAWRWASYSCVIAFFLIVVELAVLNLPFNATAETRYYAPPVPMIDRLHALAPEEPFRVAGLDWTFLPNTSAIYRLEDVRGSDPMAWQPYVEFFADASVPTEGADLRRIIDPAHPHLDLLGVRFLLADPEQSAGEGWRLVYEGADGRLYENEQWKRRFFEVEEGAAATARRPAIRSLWTSQTRPGRFRLTVDAERHALIGSSQPDLPGWRVRVDGQPAGLVDLAEPFVAFRVPAGMSRVVVDYQPTSVWLSAWISVLSLLGWFLWFRTRVSPRARSDGS
ncbi:MAG: hypothetical protein KY459_06680 [Acidobacteria bacterium]|nr:hypothetical protein [Acidobacteriota bacterium]